MTRVTLPLVYGSSYFPRLCQGDRLYVDKTARIVEFLHSGDSLLFTRPRRFGKSLMLSTIESMYRGHRDLFRGDTAPEHLAAYNHPAWPWQTCPTLRLDMLQAVWQVGEKSLVPALNRLLQMVITRLGLEGRDIPVTDSPSTTLYNLVYALGAQAADDRGVSRVVVLVDEYDAPILRYMHTEQAAQIRQDLADFYGIFKSLDGDGQIEKLVMTGVTRFARESLWSTLNQVRDQTVNLQFHDLVGFTDAELDNLWDRVQDQLPLPCPSQTNGVPVSREAWRQWYNGYRFCPGAPDPIYNPLAIVASLGEGVIRNYWLQTGRLGVVERLLQESPAQAIQICRNLMQPRATPDYELRFDWLDRLEPGKSLLDVLGQLDPMPLRILLHQTGYLTHTADGAALVPPNREVVTYLNEALLYAGMNPTEQKRSVDHQARMLQAIRLLHIPDMLHHFQGLLYLLPHQHFPKKLFPVVCPLAFNMTVKLSTDPIWHDAETSGLQGDADAVLAWDRVVMVLEFKSGLRTSAQAGQQQIANRGYLRSVNRPASLYLGLSVHTVEREIRGWLCQGYDRQGKPHGAALTDQDTWPATREDVYRRWAVDTEPPGDVDTRDGDDGIC